MKMFSRHVRRELSAYCNGELAAARSRDVAEHVRRCERCRREYDEIKFGSQLAARLPLVAAPDGIWKTIAESLDEQVQTPAAGVRLSRFPFSLRPFQLATAAMVMLALGLGLAWYFRRPPTPGPDGSQPWEVAALSGAPTIGSGRIKNSAQLAVGQWLETDASSRAKINVADIGQVEVEPNSRIGLVTTTLNEHRLALERGEMRARITAPPRLFFVDTPSAVVVDYGCVYTLKVDESGAGLLHVITGWVYLVSNGRESRVPGEGVCAMQRTLGPGTPYFEDASAAFLAALTKFDFEKGGRRALDTVLFEARPRDSLTLWHLLARVDKPDRARVYDRLAELVPPPDGVTRKGVLRLDETEREIWLMKLTWIW